MVAARATRRIAGRDVSARRGALELQALAGFEGELGEGCAE